jgi:hypothetical protein
MHVVHLTPVAVGRREGRSVITSIAMFLQFLGIGEVPKNKSRKVHHILQMCSLVFCVPHYIFLSVHLCYFKIYYYEVNYNSGYHTAQRQIFLCLV